MANKLESLGMLTEHFSFTDFNGKLRCLTKEWAIIIADNCIQFIRRGGVATFITVDSIKIRSGFVDLFIGDRCVGQIDMDELVM